MWQCAAQREQAETYPGSVRLESASFWAFEGVLRPAANMQQNKDPKRLPGTPVANKYGLPSMNYERL